MTDTDIELDSLPHRPLTREEAQKIASKSKYEQVAVHETNGTITSTVRGELAGSIMEIWLDYGDKLQTLQWEPGADGGWVAKQPLKVTGTIGETTRSQIFGDESSMLEKEYEVL